MSDTPRADTQHANQQPGFGGAVPLTFARTLERELNHANTMLQLAKDDRISDAAEHESDYAALKSELAQARKERDESKKPCNAQDLGSREYCDCLTCLGFKALRDERDRLQCDLDKALARLTTAKEEAEALRNKYEPPISS